MKLIRIEIYGDHKYEFEVEDAEAVSATNDYYEAQDHVVKITAMNGSITMIHHSEIKTMQVLPWSIEQSYSALHAQIQAAQAAQAAQAEESADEDTISEG